MKSLKHIFIPAIVLLLLNYSASAQTNTNTKLSKQQTWQLLDYEQDTVYGTSVNRAYKELLKGKKSHPVIVAVIDLGVDITQEDLQGHIWTNKREIAGNGIDDDKNGYIDDVHGWNFLGGKNGQMIYETSSEADREYTRLSPEYGAIEDSAHANNKTEYGFFLKVKMKHRQDSISRNRDLSKLFENMMHRIAVADTFLQKATQKQVISFKDVDSFQPTDSVAEATKKFILTLYRNQPKGQSLDSMRAQGEQFLDQTKKEKLLKSKGNPDEERKKITGDNPFDINDRNYGNNKVGDQYAGHGTHCSGIISAIRDNGIGMDGIADNVLIMPLRAVNTLRPGDERDKDIALSIRYAVDNGAKIVSMSFGKTFSPQKQWVDDAVKYAEKKGVLLVHGAGNDGADSDSTAFFPNADFLDSSGRAKNMITVGAISIDTGFALTASFSNYGQKEVDVFAPGVGIYSSMPENKYDFKSGTSMATPVVAGVAALILEYYPDLNAEQVKDIIMKSVTSLKGKMVYKPGTEEKVDFSTLCVSGGVVNAYKALQLAAQLTSHKTANL
jgi:cell wall-associated protease